MEADHWTAFVAVVANSLAVVQLEARAVVDMGTDVWKMIFVWEAGLWTDVEPVVPVVEGPADTAGAGTASGA